jgi:hypothetical protein
MNIKYMKILVSAVLATFIIVGCSNPITTPTGSTANLFAVDSKNGKVYEVDGSPFSAAAFPLVATGQNSTGEIVFSGDTAFLAVGNYGNTSPGLYYFDASSPNPVTAQIGDKISAQYICIVSDSLGYATSADFGGAFSNAVYPFNPSHPSAGLGPAVNGFPSEFYPQDITYASGRIYVTDNFAGKVYRLNEAGTAVEASFSTTAKGTTGLLAGAYAGMQGVFVANTGGYDASWNSLPGSLDFIAADAANGTTATAVLAGYSLGGLAAFDEDTLAATVYAKTYLVDLSGPEPAVSEVTYSGSSFGLNDLAILDGKAYVPDGMNTLYRFNADGSGVEKISLGLTGEYISNVGVRH